MASLLLTTADPLSEVDRGSDQRGRRTRIWLHYFPIAQDSLAIQQRMVYFLLMISLEDHEKTIAACLDRYCRCRGNGRDLTWLHA